MAMTLKSKAILPGLNILRLFGALYIVMYHAAPHLAWAPATRFFTRGPSGTSLFFLLSGFLLAVRYGTPMTDQEQRTFMLRRAFRLLPPYYLALVTALPTFLLGSVQQGLPSPVQLLSYLLTTQTWFVGHAHDFVTPAWSMSCLLFFYLLLPISTPRLHQWKTPMLFGLLAVIWIWNLTMPQLLLHWSQGMGDGQNWLMYLHNNPLLRAPEFLVGVVLALLSQRYQWRFSGNFFLPVLAVVAGIMLILPVQGQVVDNGLFLPITILVLLVFQNPPQELGRMASTYWGKEVADATICVYIFHSLYIDAAAHLWGPSTFWSPLQLIVFLLMCVAVSLGINKWICRPLTLFLSSRYLPRLKTEKTTGLLTSPRLPTPNQDA